MVQRGRALYVSDSLGTPIHARGIYNYSLSLVEMISGLGFDITLLVERAPGYGIDRRAFDGPHALARAALDICDCAAIPAARSSSCWTRIGKAASRC